MTRAALTALLSWQTVRVTAYVTMVPIITAIMAILIADGGVKW